MKRQGLQYDLFGDAPRTASKLEPKPLEAAFMTDLMKMARSMGLECLHLQTYHENSFYSTCSACGHRDLVTCRKPVNAEYTGWPNIIGVRWAIETKRDGFEPTAAQINTHERLRHQGVPVVVVRVRHENAKGDNGSWKPIPPGWLTDYFQKLPKETEYLFFREIGPGRYMGLGNFRRAWTRCLRLAGISDFHFHDTRHIAASDLLNAGNPEQLVCQIAGWRSGNMIKQYYHKDGLRAVQKVVFSVEKPDSETRHAQSAVL